MSATVTTSPSRILVVDDEIGPRESVRMLLKAAYQVQTAASGAAALEELDRFRPDLVVCDIKMAEMDGLEVLRRIKDHDATIEVVMVTAYASLETVKMALTHGAFEYLVKPFSRQDLESVVRRALARRHTDLGRQGQVAKLVDDMRALACKTRELEEAARREAAEQSLRVTQLSLLREISRGIVTQLDPAELSAVVTGQLQAALGYDSVRIMLGSAPAASPEPAVITCTIRDAEGPLGYLMVDNRASGRPIDPRERELLEMLAESLAIAVRNARLYGALADTKRSLEQLVASAGEAIITLDGDDRVRGWNPAAERIFGLAHPDAVGRPITDFLVAGDYGDAKRRLTSGRGTDAFETRSAPGRTPAASLAVTLSALQGKRGGLEGLIAIVRDITLQREVETQLQQSEKLAALGQLAGGIAHDFNNLLQAILGYAQLMKQSPANGALAQRSLNVIESAAVDGSETVRRIQQFARLRPDEPFVRVDLRRIVEDAVAITRPAWEERRSRDNRPLELRLDVQPVPAINGRPAALTEMVTNLVLNALDAMPQGGMVGIGTRVDEAGHVTMSVADTGLGMTEDVRRRIFEPFFSTKGDAGSGLGLAMTYSIVKRHGGDIRVDSEPGRGTTFTLSFPVAVALPEPNGHHAAPLPRRNVRVLLVDDDPQVRATLTELSESVGHAVTSASGGAVALQDYAPGRYDIVLTNVGMAGMNGWELAERLRARDSEVPIVFITGWGLREEDQSRLAALGIDRCLFKPVGPVDLDAAIQAAVAGR
jgi:PAS domain S-box-containing protein